MGIEEFDDSQTKFAHQTSNNTIAHYPEFTNHVQVHQILPLNTLL